MNTTTDTLTKIGDIENQIKNSEAETRKLKAEKYALVSSVTPVVDKKAVRRAAREARCKTKNGLTIHALRLAGNEVSVTHIRYAKVPGVPTPVPVPSYMRGIYPFVSKGGATHIVITRPNGLLATTSSICHEIDSFDYKVGVKEALDQFAQEEADELLGLAPVTDEVTAPGLDPLVADNASI